MPVKVAGVLLRNYDERRDNTTNQRGGGNGQALLWRGKQRRMDGSTGSARPYQGTSEL